MSQKYSYAFDPEDTNNTAAAIFRQCRSGGKNVLDLGSGPGVVAAELAVRQGKDVTCVDASADSIATAIEAGITQGVVADLRSDSWIEELRSDSYDVVILADVLEHLESPRQLLSTIRESRLLDEETGYLVVSFPNAGHEAVVNELLSGRFTYQETGLLDSTHIRFYTLETMTSLLESCGFAVGSVDRIRRTLEQTSLDLDGSVFDPDTRKDLLRQNPELAVFQYVMRVYPSSSAAEAGYAKDEARRMAFELDEVTRRLASALNRCQEGESQLQALKEMNEALEGLLHEAESRVANELFGHETEALLRIERGARQADQLASEVSIRKLEAQLRKGADSAAERVRKIENSLQAEVKLRTRAERRLETVYASNTWRAGMAIWRVAKLPRAALASLRRNDSKQADLSTGDPDERQSVPTPDADGPVRHAYVLTEDVTVREAYREAVAKACFDDESSKMNLAIAVYTRDFDEGRGDLYVAVGLGRELSRIGYDVVYLDRDNWLDIPPGTAMYLALLESVPIQDLPADIVKVGWARNVITAWANLPFLNVYDRLLASSRDAARVIGRRYLGNVDVLPIGVDVELFSGVQVGRGRVGAVFTQNQWGLERLAHRYLREQRPAVPVAVYGQEKVGAADLNALSSGPVSYFSLPSLYSQAAVVVDDFHPVTGPYGNVNSRVYEAAAAGALVVTSQGHGLDELGLGDLPVYEDGPEFKSLVEQAALSGDFRELSTSIAERVRAQHSYRERAASFHQSVTLERMPPHGEGRPRALAFFPDYRENPYQEILYSGFRGDGTAVYPLPDIESLSFDAIAGLARSGMTVFHLNWTAPILGPAKSDSARLNRYRRFVAGLDELEAAGIPIVWTIHNVLPHESADPSLEARLRQDIANRATLIHVMNPETPGLVSEFYQLDDDKVRTIPHPSYAGAYPNVVASLDARYRLGLSAEDRVFLFFGGIRPYKGVSQLLDAFERLAQQRTDVKLVVAGKPGRFPGINEIVQRCEAHPDIVSRFELVPDVEVQILLNAADVMVLPHRKSLNSGGLHLARAFARPVIGSMQALQEGDIVGDNGIAFRWDESGDDLLRAMRQIDEIRGPGAQAASYAKGAQYDMVETSRQFAAIAYEALDKVANRRRLGTDPS